MEKLASIEKILEVSPIEGADKIEKVKVLGWDCVVRKGFFRVGDLCIYIPTDTIIPKSLLTENFSDAETKVRLTTVKMKGQISQGLILHWNYLFNHLSIEGGENISTITSDSWYFSNGEDGFFFQEGDDVTELLGVVKYVKTIPANLQGIVKGSFPEFISKTDEVRIQSEPKLLEMINGKPYYITVKDDGTSATYYKYRGKFGVCSRNLELEEGDNVYWRIARKYNLEETIPDGFYIQGEIVGPGIQENKLGLPELELHVFNLGKIVGGDKFPVSILDTKYHAKFPDLEVPTVTILVEGDNFNHTMEELIEMAKGNYPNGNIREGIVVRSVDQRISFKVINNDFLLKYKE